VSKAQSFSISTSNDSLELHFIYTKPNGNYQKIELCLKKNELLSIDADVCNEIEKINGRHYDSIQGSVSSSSGKLTFDKILHGQIYELYMRTTGCENKCFTESETKQIQTVLDIVKFGDYFDTITNSRSIKLKFDPIYLPSDIDKPDVSLYIECQQKESPNIVKENKCAITQEASNCLCNELFAATYYKIKIKTVKKGWEPRIYTISENFMTS
jgi:hypothetical protein